MTAASQSIAAERPGRPSAVRLAADQVGYAVRELWRARVVAIFTFLLRNHLLRGMSFGAIRK